MANKKRWRVIYKLTTDSTRNAFEEVYADNALDAVFMAGTKLKIYLHDSYTLMNVSVIEVSPIYN